MFKNFVIGLLLVSTAVFGWIAVRNATASSCDEVVRVSNGNVICLTNLGDVRDSEIQATIEKIREDMDWKW